MFHKKKNVLVSSTSTKELSMEVNIIIDYWLPAYYFEDCETDQWATFRWICDAHVDMHVIKPNKNRYKKIN